jgi:hypothetical protein
MQPIIARSFDSFLFGPWQRDFPLEQLRFLRIIVYITLSISFIRIQRPLLRVN